MERSWKLEHSLDGAKTDNVLKFYVNPDYESIRYKHVFHNIPPPTDPLHGDPYHWYIDRKFPKTSKEPDPTPTPVKVQPRPQPNHKGTQTKQEQNVEPIRTHDVITQFPPSCCYPCRSTPCCEACRCCDTCCCSCCGTCCCPACFSCWSTVACVLSCGFCFGCCKKKDTKIEPFSQEDYVMYKY